MLEPLFIEEIDDKGIARITLTRPDKHNAIDDQLIAELTTMLQGLASDRRVRALVLAAKGKTFSAGADLNWMQRMADYTEEQNLEDGRALANLMRTLNEFPQPTIALVQGAAYGGGIGLIACCDIAIAADSSRYCLSEVKLGLIPAVISPYVIAAMGERTARRYFLTAERFSAAEALRIGLVHEVTPSELLETHCQRMLDALMKAGPQALKAAKELIFAVSNHPIDDGIIEDTAARIARVRVSDEGREGIAAFLESRKPEWIKD